MTDVGNDAVRVALRKQDARLVLKGHVTIAMAGELHDAASKAAAHGRPVVVDASELGRVDGAALQVLIALAREPDVELSVVDPEGTLIGLAAGAGLAGELA